MTTVAWWVLIVAGVLVSVCGGYLAWLNWNDNVLSNGASVFLAAAVAFLITVLSGLKAESLEARFVAMVVLDKAGLPVWGQPSDGSLPDRAIGKLVHLRSIADSAAEVTSETTAAVKPTPFTNPAAPPAEEEAAAFSYTADLLQYFLLREIQTLGPRAGVSIQLASDIQFRIRPAVEAPLEALAPEQIEGLSENRFSAGGGQLEGLRLIPIRVPRHTKVRLVRGGSPELHFSRQGYYYLRINLRSLGGVGLVPKLYRPLGKIGELRSFPYEVHFDAHFDRLASASEYTRLTKAWIQALVDHYRTAAEYVPESD